MLHPLPLYLLKVNIAICIFYGFYVLLLKRRTFFQLNRFYLLYTLLISFFIPFIDSPFTSDIEYSKTPIVQKIALPISQQSWSWQYENFVPIQQKSLVFSLSLGDIFLLVYFIGAILFLFNLGIRIFKLIRIIKKSRKQKQGTLETLVHPDVPTSSFFSYLFWNGKNQKSDHLLLAHEIVHIRQWHSTDIILVEIAKILLWFNPIIHHILLQLRLLHEFIADRTVVHQSQDRATYIQLLQNHAVAPTPILAHHFHSFFKSRLLMLHRKNSSVYTSGYYLLFIPILIGVALLVMAPGSESILSRAENEWQQIEDKTLVSLRLNEQKTSPYVSWDNQEFPLHPFSSFSSRYVMSIDLDKSQVLNLLKSELKVTDPDYSAVSTFRSYNVTCQDFYHPNGPLIESSQDEPDQWKDFTANIRENPEMLSDGCRIRFQISTGEKIYIGSFTIKDEKSRSLYLKHADRRFITEYYHPSEMVMPFVFRNNTNQITYRDLLQLLSHNQHQVTDHGTNQVSKNFNFYALKDLSRPLDRIKLIDKIEKEKSISFPIALIVRTSEKSQFISVFDQHKIAQVRYKTWHEYLTQPNGFALRNIKIAEKVDVHWGHLDLFSPGINGEQSFFERGPQSTYLRENKEIVTIDGFKEILNSVPNLWVNGQSMERCNIAFKYIDRQYLPFECELTYDQGRLIAGEEYIDAINERIKSGDFIQNITVSSDGKLMFVGVNVRIQ